MPVNRLVAFIVGPIITLLAGYISLWLSRHFPGAHLPDQKTIAGVLTTGALTLAPMILAHLKIKKWLDGWQSYEERLDEGTRNALDASVKSFLEELAEKTGTELPSGVTMKSLGGSTAPGGVEYAEVEPPPALRPGAFGDDPTQG